MPSASTASTRSSTAYAGSTSTHSPVARSPMAYTKFTIWRGDRVADREVAPREQLAEVQPVVGRHGVNATGRDPTGSARGGVGVTVGRVVVTGVGDERRHAVVGPLGGVLVAVRHGIGLGGLVVGAGHDARSGTPTGPAGAPRTLWRRAPDPSARPPRRRASRSSSAATGSTEVDAELAAAFRPGDRLIVVQETGDLLHVPAAEHAAARGRRRRRGGRVRRPGAAATDDQITTFFDAASPAASPTTTRSAPIRRRQRRRRRPGRGRRSLDDPARAHRRPCATTWSPGCGRGATPTLRRDAALGRRSSTTAGRSTARRAPLGRRRVRLRGPAQRVRRRGRRRCAPATPSCMRIGSDALGDGARPSSTHALEPALAAAGLPAGAVSLVRSPARSAGWALFDDRRLVARRRQGIGRRRRPARCRRPPGRHAGQPARHRRRLAGGRRRPPTPTASAPPSSTRSTARCATRSTCAASRPVATDLVAVFLDALDEAAARRGGRGRASTSRPVVAGRRARRRASTTEVEVPPGRRRARRAGGVRDRRRRPRPRSGSGSTPRRCRSS